MAGKGIKAGRAYVELYADKSQLMRGLKGAQQQLQKFGAAVTGIGVRLMAAGAALGVPFIYAIKQAGTALETLNKFKVVFGEQAKAAEAFVQTLVKGLGRSRTEMRDTMASMQAFFVGLGFGGKQAEKMSEQMVQLGIDFGSFWDMQDVEAMEKFQSGLSGMARPLRIYGINLLDSAVAAKALEMGLAKSTSELTMQQKVVARMAIIKEVMAAQDAIGDATRTAGSFANRMKALHGTIKNLSEEIGNTLLPVVTPLVDKAVSVVKWLSSWAKQNKKLILTVAKIAAIVFTAGAALVAFGATLTAIGFAFGGLIAIKTTIVGMFILLKSALLAILSPISIFVVALGAIVYYSGAAGKMLEWLKGKFAVLKTDALDAFGAIKDALKAGDIKLAAEIFWGTLEVAFLEGTQKLRETWVFFLADIKKLINDTAANVAKIWETMVRGADTVTDAIGKSLVGSKEGKESYDKMEKHSPFRAVMGEIKKTHEAFVQIASGAMAGIAGAISPKYTAKELMEQVRQIHDVKRKILDAEQQQAVANGNKTKDEVFANIDKENKAKNKAADDEAKKSFDKIRADLAAKKKALEEYKKKAKEAAEAVKAAGEAAPDLGKYDPAKIKAGLAGGIGGGIDVAGTFSAAATWGMGITNPMDRTAKATEDIAKTNKKIEKNTKDFGLTFGAA